MMQFINPLELLALENLDAKSIKRARKRKMAEIDLSDDNFIEFEGKKIERHDLIELLDMLDDTQKITYYALISKENKKLSDFLKFGKLDFFEQKTFDVKLKNRYFFQFIAPFFSYQFDKVYVQALKNNEIDRLRLLNKYELFVKPNAEAQLFRSSTKFLREQVKELEGLVQDIKNEVSDYNASDIYMVVETIEFLFSIKTANALCDYFEGARNEIGKQLRNLSVVVFNQFDDFETALRLVDVSLSLKLSGMTKVNIEKNKKELVEIKEKRTKAAVFEEIATPFLVMLTMFHIVSENIEEDNYESLDAIKKQLPDIIDTDELNALPSDFQELKEQIAIGLREIAFAIWERYNDFEYCKHLLEMGLSIDSSSEIKIRLFRDLNILNEIKYKELAKIIVVLAQIRSAFKSLSGGQTVNILKTEELINELLPNATLQTFAKKGGKILQELLDELIPILELLRPSFATSKLKILLENTAKDDINYERIHTSHSIFSSRQSSNLSIFAGDQYFAELDELMTMRHYNAYTPQANSDGTSDVFRVILAIIIIILFIIVNAS